MARDFAIRGETCRYCEHNMRLFSTHCGRCGRRKAFVQRLPAYVLRSTATVAVIAGAGVIVVGGHLLH